MPPICSWKSGRTNGIGVLRSASGVNGSRRYLTRCQTSGELSFTEEAVADHAKPFEQDRCLIIDSNSEMDSVAPFAGLLLGQPMLRRRIKLGSFATLDQRIMLRYSLPGMTEPETKDYLSHHVKLVGRSD